jgi:hypothetical protein
MHRRTLILASGFVPALAWAHHGWSSFDPDRPVWLEGRAQRVKWQNPHAEFELERTLAAVPADLARRSYPAQSSRVDGAALAAKATVPSRQDRLWTVELAPLSRMNAWKVPEIQPGEPVGVLGFTFKEEKGDPLVRGEFLFLRGQVYGLRSGPA